MTTLATVFASRRFERFAQSRPLFFLGVYMSPLELIMARAAGALARLLALTLAQSPTETGYPRLPTQLGGYMATVATYLWSAYVLEHYADDGEAGWPAALGRLTVFLMAVHVTLACRRSVWFLAMGVSYVRLVKWHVWNGFFVIACALVHAGEMVRQRRRLGMENDGDEGEHLHGHHDDDGGGGRGGEHDDGDGRNAYGFGPRFGEAAIGVVLFMLFMVHIRWKRYEWFFRVHQLGYIAVVVLARTRGHPASHGHRSQPANTPTPKPSTAADH